MYLLFVNAKIGFVFLSYHFIISIKTEIEFQFIKLILYHIRLIVDFQFLE